VNVSSLSTLTGVTQEESVRMLEENMKEEGFNVELSDDKN